MSHHDKTLIDAIRALSGNAEYRSARGRGWFIVEVEDMEAVREALKIEDMETGNVLMRAVCQNTVG